MDEYASLSREYEEKVRKAEERVASGERSQRDCDLCGEPLDEEIGEFYDPEWPDNQGSVIAHAQCGLDNHLEIA